MEEALAVIEQIIAEHEVIKQRFQAAEQIANDAEALAGFDKAKEAFMPGRLAQQPGLQELQASLTKIEQGLHRHFHLEETNLPGVVGEYGDEENKSDLRSLLLEHKDLRNRLVHSKKHVAELVEGNLSRHLWEASAHDMRAYFSHTRKLLEAHAEIEQELLHELRHKLRKGSRRNR
jgi:hypothetical protein